MSDKLDKTELEALEKEILHHNRLYWDDEKPEISDYDYDRLVVRLKTLAPASKVLDGLGPSRLFGTPFKHKEAMLSLDKCYEAEELTAWAGTFEGAVIAMPKFDGIACSLHYDASGNLEAAVTRGDGVTGDNITANALVIKDIPSKIDTAGPLEVRGEIYMKLSVFAKYKEEGMANPRNLAAGAIKQKDRKKSAAYGLSFAGYDLVGGEEATQEEELRHLVKKGFPPVDHRLVPRENITEGFEYFAKARAELDYEIDGVVYKVNEIKEQRRLGQTSHHPRYAIAYKFQGDAGLSTLNGVEWSVARTGAITPVAIVDPVSLSGVTVTRASLHNVAFIDRLGLTLGAKVTLVRRGGVIPNVEFVTEPGSHPVVIPAACPSCGSTTTRERDFLFCSTPRTCKRAILGQLAHYAGVTDMLGFGESILEGLYDASLVRDAADFYTLDASGIAKLERSGGKLAKKLTGEVAKKKTLPLGTFLRALGIAELGKNVSQILADRYRTLDAVLAVTEEELAQTHGIGGVIAKSVVLGLSENKDLIARLRTHVAFLAAAGPVDGPLSGKSFVFTGKMVSFARSEGEKRVRAQGGAVLSSVTKTLDYLVIGADKSGGPSAKEKAAEKFMGQGATLTRLSEDELLAMLARGPADGASATPLTPDAPIDAAETLEAAETKEQLALF